MIKRMILMLVIFLLVAGGLAYYKYSQIQKGIAQSAAFVPPPVAVTSATASSEAWHDTINTVGSLSAVRGVTVSAEEEGKVVSIPLESGARVKKGDLLLQQDVAVEEAQLKSVIARAELAVSNLHRLEQMKDTGAVAQKELDDADAELKQATAEAEALKATIERKTIRAPFDGICGIRIVQLGQYLSKGDPIIPLQTLDPIYIDFTAPQQDIARLKIGQSVNVSIDAFPERQFSARISAINPVINQSTRTVQVQATMENKDELLRPGMYAVISTEVGDEHAYVTIPTTAVNRAPYGDSVYIIEMVKGPDGSEYKGVRQAFVQVGPTRGDQIAILKGVNAGEEVVTSGLFKLHPHAAVNVNNEITPENKAQPKPEDS